MVDSQVLDKKLLISTLPKTKTSFKYIQLFRKSERLK